MKTVILDLDGCVRNFVKVYTDIFKEQYPEKTHLIKRIDSFGLQLYFPQTKQETIDFMYKEHVSEIFDTRAELYDERDPQLLKDFMAAGNSIQIGTMQPAGTEIHTLNFIRDRQIPYDVLAFTKNKNVLDGEFIIEDSYDNLVSAREHGKVAICIDHTWNRTWDGYRVHNLREAFDLVNKYQIHND